MTLRRRSRSKQRLRAAGSPLWATSRGNAFRTQYRACRQEFALIADQSARWHMRNNAFLPDCWRISVNSPLRRRSAFRSPRLVIIIHIDGHLFGQLHVSPSTSRRSPEAADRQLKPLTPHVFDQNAHLQFTAPIPRTPRRPACRRSDGELDSALHEAVADDAALHLLPSRPARAVVDPEGYGDGAGRWVGVQGFIHCQYLVDVGSGLTCRKADDIGDGFVDVLRLRARKADRDTELLDLLSDAVAPEQCAHSGCAFTRPVDAALSGSEPSVVASMP